MTNRVAVKADAKSLMRTAHTSPLLVTAVLMAICFLLDRFVDLAANGSLFYSYTFNWAYYQAILSGDNYSLQALLDSIPAITANSFFFSILVSLFTQILNGGYYIYCIGIRRGAEMPCSTLLDGLGVAGKLIWCTIQVSVRVFLWSMLFFIPGIIAAYRYRFAYYNLLTDSSLSASEAIQMSCLQTRGMKLDLFVLDVSFLGWDLLSYLTGGLLGIWLTPYRTLCDLAYFEEGQRRVGRVGPGWEP